MKSTVSGISGGSGSKRPVWLIPVIAVVCAVVLVVAGVFGWRAWDAHELAAAKADCAAAAEKVRESANGYNQLLNGEAAEASMVKADQVKDKTTRAALAKELKAPTPEYEGCVADDASGLNKAATTLDGQADWYAKHTKSLDKAVKRVNASKAAKTLDTAKTSLKSKLEEASKLLADSDGEVADNATRDNLMKAIDAARKLTDGNDPAKLDQARKSVEDAMKQVNDSIQAKNDADKAAADAAAQQAAAAQSAASATPSYNTGSYGYSRNYGYSGGNTYRPSSGGSASTNSGSSGNDDHGGAFAWGTGNQSTGNYAPIEH
ncbi:FIVAR domain-containing protein [Bifidobacterium sp. LC6]|uniref:FIVAR domain-containing protein n=1 Tax=Bifidobacterium colobi TaxID=2809026 RepID=A0ABS5UVL1_9BIFI|nr:colicin transporter [Bifidobacterium colobi]MBT1174761.1 FIVAR domain-containing protein [Bifidobacterium colobi]